jgi:uncharacterized protein (DUF1800 family)
MTPEKATAYLVDYESLPQTVAPLPSDDYGNIVSGGYREALQQYWLFRICETARPLEETMTLFWHGHFATSDYKVQNDNMMWRQNETLRKHAMGSFRDLLGVIAIDPAMLVWLDGNGSKKNAPNENFSREVLELFPMGVDGGYSEVDIKQGAKSFTGWSYDDDANKINFAPRNWDPADKHYLGTVGPWDLDQTLDIIAKHPSTARFISKKLFEFFVFDNPPKEELDRLSAVYFKTHYSIRELVRAVLTSPHFYSDQALYSRVKSPVQFAVSTVKLLDLPNKWISNLNDHTNRMGQELLNPPNVKGWRGGESWMNTNTIVARMNFATDAVNAIRYRGLMRNRITDAFQAHGWDPEKAFGDPDTAVQAIWDWMLPSTTLSEPTRRSLVAYLKTGAPKQPNADYYWERAFGLVNLLITSPEFQNA